MPDFRPHDMLPSPRHDEQARQDFVSALRAHLSGRLMPGAYQVYARRVEPRLRAELGREPDESEVRRAMTGDPYYQFWSALQRRSQEMLWESVIDPTERELPDLVGRARARRDSAASDPEPRGSLRLDPALPLPRYHAAVDIHLQPGAYHTDSTADDVAAGAIYDKGINLYMGGALGAENGLMGETLVAYLRRKHPGFAPRRILDMGCAIGNSTVVWARAFPEAEVHGIDVGAPVLRYAHARAEGFGVPVHFSQQNAEGTDLEAGSFDLVVSHIMLHETSKAALPRIFAECHRLLRPGGLMLHLEIPRGQTVFEQFMHNWESYNNNETFSRYMTRIDLAAEAVKGGFAAAAVQVDEYATEMSLAQTNYAAGFVWKILAGSR
jgi:ubiquinone/menaquinone biosynthesis C-methylase UbiE